MKAGSVMDIQECHRILQVKPGVDWLDIKKSFHVLAREYHPDRNAGNRTSEEKFKEISRAYETLERWHQGRSFTYRVYAQSAPSPQKASPFFETLAEGLPNRLFQWTMQARDWLGRHEAKWLKFDVEKTVTIDSMTAAQGGTLKIKTPTGGFHVQIPAQAPDETILRIPGKGEVGLFHRAPGDLFLKIQVAPDKKSRPQQAVTEFFYQVRVFKDQSPAPKMRTLVTHEGPIQYRLPKEVKAGQSFVLKSKPHPRTGRTNHHILLIDFL